MSLVLSGQSVKTRVSGHLKAVKVAENDVIIQGIAELEISLWRPELSFVD